MHVLPTYLILLIHLIQFYLLTYTAHTFYLFLLYLLCNLTVHLPTYTSYISYLYPARYTSYISNLNPYYISYSKPLPPLYSTPSKHPTYRSSLLHSFSYPPLHILLLPPLPSLPNWYSGSHLTPPLHHLLPITHHPSPHSRKSGKKQEATVPM
jgi:hypothetical protein